VADVTDQEAITGSILMVDDEDPILEVTGEILRENGYAFHAARNGVEGFSLAVELLPDLILLDISMPVMDGFDTCRRLRANFLTRNIPVVMFTSLSDRESRVRALSLGATEFLSKPIDATELLVRVRNLLKLKKYQDFLEEHGRILEERVAERTKELREAFIETIQRLTLAAEFRDEDTYVHVHRISHYTEVLVSYFDLSPAVADLMIYASPMHDIGKVGIPDSILLKRGPLTDDEFEVIKGHTTIGARILANSRSPYLVEAEKFALYHHERWDGSGYPLGLKGEEIPIEGRILNIIDQYDALRSRRPYKEAWSHEDAMDVITKGDGRTHPGHFDPIVLSRFLEAQDRIREIYDRHASGA
jgi:putative two-component system response regulator